MLAFKLVLFFFKGQKMSFHKSIFLIYLVINKKRKKEKRCVENGTEERISTVF